jgi:hydrogenase maturation protein HypF
MFTVWRSNLLEGMGIEFFAGVFIEIEGSEEVLQAFLDKLQQEPPPLADIRSCTKQEIEWTGYADLQSKPAMTGRKTVMISPDIAICKDCRYEVRNMGSSF